MLEVIERDELKLLLEVGMLAATQGDVEASKVIFDAIEQERPDAPASYVGPAIALLFRGRTADAIGALQRGLKVVGEADRPDLQALLGVALHIDGRGAESDQALQASHTHPLSAALLARAKRTPLGG